MIPATKPTPLLRRAMVALGVLVIMLLLGAIVAGMVLVGARDQDLSGRSVEGMRAFYATEGALQMATRETVLGTDEDGDGVIGGVTGMRLGSSTAAVTKTDQAPLTTLTATGINGPSRRRSASLLRSQSSTSGGSQGVQVEVFTLASAPSSLASVPWSSVPNWIGVTPDINMPNRNDSSPRFPGQPSQWFAIRARATLTIPTAGSWTFALASDDGSDLWIDGARVVLNDGLHAVATQTGTVMLSAGPHDLEARMFENTGNNAFMLSWRGPGVPSTTIIPATAFSTTAAVPWLALHNRVRLWGDTTATATKVDAYDAAAGAYGGSNVLATTVMALNSTSSLQWEMSGNASLLGNAVVGPGGNPSSVIATYGTSSITGTRTAGTQRVAMFLAAPSVTMPASSGNLTLWSGSQTINSNRRYGSLTIGNDAIVDVTSDVVIQIDGDAQFSSGAQLRILNGANVVIYLGGKLDLFSTARVNINTGMPAQLRIYMTRSSRNVQITDLARLSAYVSNPFGTLLVYPNGNIVDSFSGRFQGDSIETSDKAQIHIDVGGTGSGSTQRFQVLGWNQSKP